MARRDEYAREREGKFVPWKPDRCHDCPAPHPCLSHDGRAGPWRCAPCHAKAGPRPVEGPGAPERVGQAKLI